ncbi:MAG: alpha/beta hydrolase [Chloroflexi bacterium]|nr:alpha/beta hydrolase [Chloroflexota bacterium]
MPDPDPERLRVPVTGDVTLSVVTRAAAGGVTSRRPSCLLVHGLASNARLWDGVATELARLGHASVAVDQRGHGRSDTPDTGYDFETLVADLVAVIDTLGLERPVVAGQSWGANVALELGVRHPERVAAVVCVDGAIGDLVDRFPAWETAERLLAPPVLLGAPRVSLETRIRASHPDWSESAIEGVLANFRVLDDGTVAPWLTRERHMAILRHLWEHRPSVRYPSLRVPVTLLVAEPAAEDPARRVAREAAVTAIEASTPTARVTWFRSGDHDLHAQVPEQVAAAILGVDGAEVRS